MIGTFKKNILYCGEFRFPDGSAGAHYVLSIGKILRALKYDVVFLGSEPRGSVREESKTCGFQYLSDPSGASTSMQRLVRYLAGHLAGQSILQRVRRFPPSSVAAVFAYQLHSIALSRLSRYCRQNAIPLIANVVEWYDASHMPFHQFADRLDVNRRMYYMRAHVDHFLVISRYLERFFIGEGRHVLCLPPLIDAGDPKWQIVPHMPASVGPDMITLVYAGAAHKKDLIANAVRGLHLANDPRFHLLVIGTSRESVHRQMGADAALLDILANQLIFLGYLPEHSEVLAAVKASDFSVILKPETRQAHACFPSKLPESLALGVPVIANKVSDLCEYLADGSEGLLLDSEAPASFAAALNRIARMGAEERMAMRAKSRQKATEAFDYRARVEAMGGFLRKIESRP
jgi:glycosyltransferase involved in cell wall biosynthesis